MLEPKRKCLSGTTKIGLDSQFFLILQQSFKSKGTNLVSFISERTLQIDMMIFAEGMRLMLGPEGPAHETTSHRYQYSATQSRKR